jgi:endonuclease/exonuclease/phosphatase family metal-dependent hydrolase
VSARIEFDRRQLLLISAHFNSESVQMRCQQADEIAEFVENENAAVIVAGDFNSQWSREDDGVRRLANRLKLTAFSPDDTSLATFPAASPARRIDWILVSGELEFVRHEIGKEQLSDHLAVAADLRWRTAK